ncbi:hypothetical protein ACFTWF_23735 [Rhodococcus sp. NPDC056960]|uniref:hypothetical protein n=1 Tax=Rhodococcus sp. NPDC056960 TaxID=3345982 RepID=UPI0036260030
MRFTFVAGRERGHHGHCDPATDQGARGSGGDTRRRGTDTRARGGADDADWHPSDSGEEDGARGHSGDAADGATDQSACTPKIRNAKTPRATRPPPGSTTTDDATPGRRRATPPTRP